MSRRAARSKLCPTPSKQRYGTADDASEAGQRVAAQLDHAHLAFQPFYVYQCPCLWWHLTSHPYDRNGVRHARA